MLINMTVVFGVLFGLSIMIRVIHFIDPTKKKQVKPKNVKVASTVHKPDPRKPRAQRQTRQPRKPAGIPEADVAAIAAALAMMGYSGSEIHAIRPVVSNGWRNADRKGR